MFQNTEKLRVALFHFKLHSGDEKDLNKSEKHSCTIGNLLYY